MIRPPRQLQPNNQRNTLFPPINKTKRVLVATGIYPPDIGGPATYSKLLKEEWPKYSKEKIRAIILNFGSFRRWPRGLRHLIYFFKAWGLARYCDVLYAQDPVSVGWPTAIVAKITRKPFMLKIVGDYAWEQGVARFDVKDSLDDFSTKSSGYHWFVNLLKKIECWVASQATYIVVPSEYLKTIVSNWGIPAEKIVVIYNAFVEPSSLIDKEVLRSRLGVQGQLLVSIGRLVPWKGFGVLIESMTNVLAKYPEAKLLIIGDGPEKDSLESLVRDLGLEDSILLTGKLDKKQLHTYIRAADLFVLNTSYEGFSHQLLEVASLETPIITTKIGGNPEFITDRVNGLLINPNDKKQLSQSIIKILDDSSMADTLVVNAKKRVVNFSVERMIGELTTLLLRCGS